MKEKIYQWTDEDYLKLYRLVFGKDDPAEPDSKAKQAMRIALGTLQPEERKALYLSIHRGLGYFAMSILMFRTPKRSKIYLYRAARKLRHPSRSRTLAKHWRECLEEYERKNGTANKEERNKEA